MWSNLLNFELIFLDLAWAKRWLVEFWINMLALSLKYRLPLLFSN
jgi:hypothetical protein